MELCIQFGDKLCDVNRFTEALCAYVQALMSQKPKEQNLNHDILLYFADKIVKLTTKSQKSQSQQQQTGQLPQPKKLEESGDKNVDHFLMNVGEPSFDPLSCPFCYSVLVEPVTLPCGHTFCRNHVINPSSPSLCFKCKAPWRTQEPRLVCTPSGHLERQQSKPEDDLKVISTNTLVNTLVDKYWNSNLKSADIRTKANKLYSMNQLKDALKLYNQAFDLNTTDHLILGNRSITYLKMGNAKAALEDAELAIKLRPDWGKGYLRKGMAHRVLGNHTEAFKAFYNCLTLEGAQARPVKLEMAKELYQLLKSSIVNIGRDSVSVNSDQSDPHSSNTSLSDDFYSCKPSDLPNCLVELGEFLDNLGHEDPTFIDMSKNQWLNVYEQTYRLPCRAIYEKIESFDYECPLCMRLLWKPVTTPCGHTFCKVCLDRVLDHNTCCPMCKSATLKTYLCERKETNPTEMVEYVMKKFLKDEYEERQKIHESDMQQLVGQTGVPGSSHVPVFVCTLSFPNISCPLHVFEPRYRLMIRRCMEVGTREFGMCCTTSDSDKPFADYGTMLEIRDIQFFPDGRSIVDTIGGRRFKVIERSILDGYNTAKVEFLMDEPIENDKLQELKDLHDDTLQQTLNWFESSAPNIRSGIVAHYGGLPKTESNYWTLPNGPTWSWWILNILPIDPSLKVHLLSMTSLKKRLENTRRILRFLSKAGKPKEQRNNC